jgi:hypothetical protein
VYQDFEVGVNYNYAEFNFDQQKTQVLKLVLTTPETQSESIIRKQKLFKNFGFNVSGRYNTLFMALHSRDGMPLL